MKPRVVYWHHVPTPYMVERLNVLCRRDQIDLEVWFTYRQDRMLDPGANWQLDKESWSFQHKFLKSVPFGSWHIAIPVAHLMESRPDIVIMQLYGGNFPGWTILRKRSIPVAMWAEVAFESWSPRSRWKDLMLSQLFSKSDGIITVGSDGRAYAEQYGARPDHIYYARHGIDVNFFRESSVRARVDREALRSKLGLKGVAFAYVGRLHEGKGIDILFDAYAVLQRRMPDDVSLLVIGDGPELERLQARCRDERLDNVIFVPFLQKRDLPAHYAASDVFIFPSLGDPYGLVVDEAMACQLPVISSKVGEIHERIEEGVNGFVVAPGNSAELMDRMERLARSGTLRDQMARESGRKIEGHTPDQWARNIEDAVYRILANE